MDIGLEYGARLLGVDPAVLDMTLCYRTLRYVVDSWKDFF